MSEDPVRTYPAKDFEEAVWVSGKVQGSDRSYWILAFNNLISGCIFGRYLAQCRKDRYVVVAELVHRHEASCKDIVYKRTGVKVVVKAFTNKDLAAKEADAVKWACGDLDNIRRLTRLVAQLRDHDTSYILFDYIEGGDLCTYICSMNGAQIPHPVAIRWMSDLLHCLTGLQRRGIAHMDLSSENILIDKEGHCRLIDFEMAYILPPAHAKGTLFEGVSRCGKDSYMAPEVYRSMPCNPLAVDIWSLGVIFYIITTGMPLYAKAGDNAFLKLEKGFFEELVAHYKASGCQVPEGWVKDMIRTMLHPNPLLRPSPALLLDTFLFHQEPSDAPMPE